MDLENEALLEPQELLDSYMSDIIRIYGKNIVPSEDVSLKLCECSKDNPAFNQLQGIFAEQKNQVIRLIEPQGVYVLSGDLEVDTGQSFQEMLLSMSTLGSAISSYMDECMKIDLMTGLMVGFMADSCLFELENQMKTSIRSYLNDLGCGVSRILEPSKHLPGEYLKTIYDKLDARNTLGISLTSSYMLNPIKSMGLAYVVSDNPEEFGVAHDCSRCTIAKCPLRSTM